MFELKKAQPCDYERLIKYYRNVVETTETMTRYCRWIYGLHPTDELIDRYIKEGAMYYSEKQGEISSAVVVLPYQDGEYGTVNWGADFGDSEVATLHILCTNPKFSRQGLAKATVAASEQIARELHKKAVRLDTLETNLAAQSLYESIGYTKRDKKLWYASNLGNDYFILYEKMLNA